jgi:hypothetical protein
MIETIHYRHQCEQITCYKLTTQSCGWKLRLQCPCEHVDSYVLQREYRGDRKCSSIPIAPASRLDHLMGPESVVSVSWRQTLTKRDHTYFLPLFPAPDPPGSSTSMPSTSRPSFRPAAAAARLLAFCFSRRRSATSLSTTLSASWCSVSSRALATLCSDSETSFASSVWMSVEVVEDLLKG